MSLAQSLGRQAQELDQQWEQKGGEAAMGTPGPGRLQQAQAAPPLID